MNNIYNLYDAIDPCKPCLCPKAPCEQCIFGYKPIEERCILLKDIIKNNKYPIIVERYKLFHNK